MIAHGSLDSRFLKQCFNFQVKGLHAEYDRLSSQQPKDGGTGPGSLQAQLKADLKSATSKLKEAEVCEHAC